jgi:hypothetical protein
MNNILTMGLLALELAQLVDKTDHILSHCLLHSSFGRSVGSSGFVFLYKCFGSVQRQLAGPGLPGGKQKTTPHL